LLQQMADLYDICGYVYKEFPNSNIKTPITGGGGPFDRYNYNNLNDAQQQCDIMDECTGITKDNAGFNLRLGPVTSDSRGFTSWQKQNEKVCTIESTMRDTYNVSETEITEIQTRYTNDPDNISQFNFKGVKTEIKIDPTTPTTLYYYSESKSGMGGLLNIHTLSQKADTTDVIASVDSEKIDRETGLTAVESLIDSDENALDLKENKSDTFTYMVSVRKMINI